MGQVLSLSSSRALQLGLNDSRNTLLRRLTAVSWRDWALYTLFAFTFAGLCLLADEIHWQSDVHLASLSVADNGRLIGVITSSNQSMYRNRFYLFDSNLQLKHSFRLRSGYSWGAHSLSQDGRYLLYVASDKNPWITSSDTLFEVYSLDGSSDPVSVALAEADIATMLGHDWNSYGVLGLQLIGDPPEKFLWRTSADMFLVNLSGKIESYSDWTFYGSTLNSKYATTTADTNAGTCLLGFKIDSDGLQRIFQKRINPDPRQSRFAINPMGLLASQDKNQIIILDLKNDDQFDQGTAVPWPMAKGKLTEISDDGSLLLLEGEKHIYAVSTQTQAIVGELSLPDSVLFNSAALLDDHRFVLDKVSRDGKQRELLVWNWKESTAAQMSFENHSDITKSVIDWAFIVLTLIWSSVFFRWAVQGNRTVFGFVLLIAALFVFIRCSHLAPSAERLIIYFERMDLPIAPILCQVGLSVVSLWAFRYLSFTAAGAITIVLSCYAANWYHVLAGDGFGCYFVDGRFYFQNMVLAFAIEMICVQLWNTLRSNKKPTLTIGDLLVITVATAIVVRLLMKIIVENQELDTIILGIAGGTMHLIVTMYADYRSKYSLRWSDLFWLPLIVLAYFAFAYLLACILFLYLHSAGAAASATFWMNLRLSHLIVFVLTWGLLRLAYRYLEQPATAIGSVRSVSQ